jgi:hypothetical protein
MANCLICGDETRSKYQLCIECRPFAFEIGLRVVEKVRVRISKEVIKYYIEKEKEILEGIGENEPKGIMEE